MTRHDGAPTLTIAPADLILDVTRAADPRRVAQAMQRLDEGRSAAFASAMERPALPAREAAAADIPAAAAPVQKPLTAFQQMEGFFLRQFLESVLPRSETLFGKGQSGDLWRSMMAEKMGETIARQGRIGIASHLAQRMPVQAGPVA